MRLRSTGITTLGKRIEHRSQHEGYAPASTKATQATAFVAALVPVHTSTKSGGIGKAVQHTSVVGGTRAGGRGAQDKNKMNTADEKDCRIPPVRISCAALAAANRKADRLGMTLAKLVRVALAEWEPEPRRHVWVDTATGVVCANCDEPFNAIEAQCVCRGRKTA